MIAKYFDIPNSAFELRPVFANPPFNPAMRGTNFALVQHFIHQRNKQENQYVV
jgi:carbonic anhydrase